MLERRRGGGYNFFSTLQVGNARLFLVEQKGKKMPRGKLGNGACVRV